MEHTDKYEKTEEWLLDVIGYIDELTKDRYIASLYVRQMSPIDVQIRLAEVRRCLSTVNGETLRLAKLEMTYNKDFAVVNNQRFTTAERLFNRLRSSMAIIRKELRRSCPIIRKRPSNPNVRPSVFERSVLTKGCCARDLFDLTTFDDDVQALYCEERALFANVILSLSICSRVIQEERETKADPDLCVQRLEDQCKRILKELENVMSLTKDIPDCEIQRLIDQMGKKAYAQEFFHQPSVEQLTTFAICEAQRQARENQLPPESSIVFKNADLAARALVAIAHFDEVRPSNRKKMDAFKIRLFCNWCDGGRVDNPKEKYYQFLLKQYRGKHEQYPEWHAVTTSKKGRDVDAEQAVFNEEMDALLKKHMHTAMNSAS